MPSPRETLRASIRDCLVRIKQADGYLTNIGNYVKLEPGPVAASEDSTEFVTVVVSLQERASDAFAKVKRKTTVSIVAKIPARLTEVQSRLDAVITDIELAMADQHFRYPAGYEFPRYESMTPLVPQATDTWVGAVLTYTSLIPIRTP